jgi:hypothetical protein
MDLSDVIKPTINYDYTELFDGKNNYKIPVPKTVDIELHQPYLKLPIPLDWDKLLRLDKNYLYSNLWRQATRVVLDKYHANGYTTIGQVSDKASGVNLQILAHNFDPYNPPSELLV